MRWNSNHVQLLQKFSITLLLAIAACVRCSAAKEAGAIREQRMTRSAQFLSADELEGRGLETEGLRRAAEFVREEFRSAGLELLPANGDGFQSFPYAVSSELGTENYLELNIPAVDNNQASTISLSLDKDFMPLALSGSTKFDLPLAFVGYGISAPNLHYDDYADIDVEGKAVIVLRHEPQQGNPHSAFDGTDNSRHAPLSAKVSAAYQHGAAAVVFCTDEFEIDKRAADIEKRWEAAKEQLKEADELESSPEKVEAVANAKKQAARWEAKAKGDHDELLKFSTGESATTREIAVLHCRRDVIDRVLHSAGKPSLSELEKTIDKELKPQSFDLTDYRIRGEISIERVMAELTNVIGMTPGAGPLAEETIVVGAHYDHLGRGEAGSAEPDSTQIHNGADDNASGVAVLIDLVRKLAKWDAEPRRRILFVAFTGEERGLLGSAQFVQDCPVPVESIKAMINFDMVGRMKENKLIASGFDTATQFDGWLDEINHVHQFDLTKQSGGFGPSDHATFYAKQIPVVHFFTGAHSDYHRPTDDFHLLNLKGMQRVSDFAADWIKKLATTEDAIEYQQVSQPRQATSSGDPRPYFGSIPDFGQADVVGYAISGVAPGSPADEAGLQGGDAIIELGPHRIGNLEDFDSALRKFEAGDRVPVVFLRKNERIESEVILDPPR